MSTESNTVDNKIIDTLTSLGSGTDILDQDVAARRHLLLERTFSALTIDLNNEQSARDYLHSLVADPLNDQLNRGLHLEYYGDAPSLPEAGVLVAKDDEKYAPVKTFEVLHRKLMADLKVKKCRAMTPIELHTLCSICISRHIKGVLAQHKRERLLELIKAFRQEDQIILPREIAPYLDMAQSLLSRAKVSLASVFADLRALRSQDRAGWNDLQEIDSSPESVSDHIWGAVLIASALLPEKMTEDDEKQGYSKARIIQMLMIHDLGETYLGDKPFFLKSEEDVAAEDRCMARITAISTLDVFNGILSWRRLWSELRDKSSINAEIAADIGAIESDLQMRRYLSKPKCEITDAEVRTQEFENKLETTLGKTIYTSLRQDH